MDSMNNSANDEHGRDKFHSERMREPLAGFDQLNAPPIGMAANIESLTAEQLVELFGSNSKSRYEGVARICWDNHDHVNSLLCHED